MADSPARPDAKPDPTLRPPPGRDEACQESCEPASGPVREAGGTTGAGNLSPGQASRTGGATGGVSHDSDRRRQGQRDVPPSA